MLSIGTLVKIKDTVGSNWPTIGEMEKYKSTWGIISYIRRRPELYVLEPLPCGGADNGITNWQWSVNDFDVMEKHCQTCGNIIEDSSENQTICDNCDNYIEQDLVRPLSINRLKNIVLTSKILPESISSLILNKIDNEEFFICEDCGKVMLSAPYTRIDGQPICNSCRDNYFICEHCGVLFYQGNQIIGQSGRYFCSIECQEEADPYCFSEELPYNAKPPVHFLGSNDANELFMGAEIEVDGNAENKADCIYDIYLKSKEEVYCKHDGSLAGGFEFVTHPATLDYHKNVLKYDKLISTCKDWGFSGDVYNTTGLHIHASKNFFGDIREGEINAVKLEIIFEKFWNHMLLFANRSIEGADRWAKIRYFIGGKRFQRMKEEDIIYFINAMKQDRYTAINITNQPTIEFRLFKGTTNKKRIFAVLELVDYLCRFVKNASFEEIKELTWEELFEGLYDTNKYENLKERLNYLGLLEKKEEIA